MTKSIQLIDTQEAFDKMCIKLANYKLLAVDTEFDRRKTYYPILSTIQINSGEDRFIIDALAKIDFSGLKPSFNDKNIVKILHSSYQDLEIFFTLFKELPQNVFDTQIAARVCGMDKLMGYGKLCKILLNIDVDKTYQKANWLVRPLTNELMKYAILDTEFLHPLYIHLAKTITDRNLWSTYETHIAEILNVDYYRINPERLINRIGLAKYSKGFIARLLHFISFREECARIINIPRNYCATDYELIRLCSTLPTNDQELKTLRIYNQLVARPRFKNKLFELCTGLKAEPDKVIIT